MRTYVKVYSNELAHHGIKGMKWGVRRYQYEDGSLTPAGRKHYGYGERIVRGHAGPGRYIGAKRQLEGYKKDLETLNKGGHLSVGLTKKRQAAYDARDRKILENRISKLEAAEAKKKRADNEPKEPKQGLLQKRKDKLIQQYMEKGYGREAAEIAAAQRLKTEIIVGSIAAVSVAVIATKVTTRIGQDYLDKTFKSGKMLQNMGAYKDATFKDQPFFAAVNNHDKKAYRMMYPNEKRMMVKLREAKGGYEYDGIFNNQIKVTKDVKRASVNNARKVLYEQMDRDPEFKKQVLNTLERTGYGKIDKDSPRALLTKDPKKFYDRFNQALATPEFQEAGIHKKYYSALEKKGYNAVLDINDTRYSGYKKISKDPTIFFGSDNFEKISNRKLSETEIDENVMKYALGTLGKNLAKTAVRDVAVISAISNVSDQKKIEKYLDEHPNSTLSRKEILKVVEGRK